MKIAIIDDEPSILHSLQSTLRSLGEHNVESFSDPEVFIDWLATNTADLIISDQRMPEISGIELQNFVKKQQPDCYRVIMSGYSDFLDVVGAFNNNVIHKFISKPWNKVTLVESLKAASNVKSAVSKGHSNTGYKNSSGLFVLDPKLKVVEGKIAKMATGNAPVHIQGESGTGKELAAKYSHQNSGVEGKFVAVNCANLQGDLLESLLFGHKKGSFTGATLDKNGYIFEANHGTLFLDEVVELPLVAQAKLLRVLQEKTYSMLGGSDEIVMTARLVTAAARPLIDAVKDGSFREDLMYRLEVMPVRLPPLRDRIQDIMPLLSLFLRKYMNNTESIPQADAGLEKTLLSYQWPGNIRQLENLAAYWGSVIDRQSGLITVNDLPENFFEYEQLHAPQIENTHVDELDAFKLTDEKIVGTLAEFKGNQSATARALGVSRMTIWRRLQGLVPPEPRA